MERPTKKVKKAKKGENEKKKKVLVKPKKTKTKTKTKTTRPKKVKQPSLLELLLLQQQKPPATGLISQPQMPTNPVLLGNIRDRVTNLQKSSGSLNDEWVKLKAMLNDAKEAYSTGTLDENDIEELWKQAKKLGKRGFRTYQDLNSTYTSAREAYDYFVSYLNNNRPEGERNFQRPPPPPPPQGQEQNQAQPPPPPESQAPSPPSPSPSPSPPPPDIPQSNTNWFYDRASQALNTLAPSGALLVGALGSASQMRNMMSRNRLNRDIQANQERGGRLAEQIQQTAVQGLGNALAEAIPRAGVNTLENLQGRVNADTERLNQIRERLQASNLQRQSNIAEQEAQRQLREQSRRPSLRESNREQIARQNLGQVENARLNTDLERVDSAGARSERWGEGTRAIRTAEEKAESARKAQRTLQEKEREMEQVQQLQEQLEDSSDDRDAEEVELNRQGQFGLGRILRSTRERQMEILERLRPVSSPIGSSEMEVLEDRLANL